MKEIPKKQPSGLKAVSGCAIWHLYREEERLNRKNAGQRFTFYMARENAGTMRGKRNNLSQ